jgi:hypothetical protein
MMRMCIGCDVLEDEDVVGWKRVQRRVRRARGGRDGLLYGRQVVALAVTVCYAAS